MDWRSERVPAERWRRWLWLSVHRCLNVAAIANLVTVTRDIVFKNLTMENMRGAAVAISQCTRFKGAPGEGNCTNSEFHVRDISVQGLTGTTLSSNIASLQCSAVEPCDEISLTDVDLKFENGTAATSYLCGNTIDPKEFECTGKACESGSSTGEC